MDLIFDIDRVRRATFGVGLKQSDNDRTVLKVPVKKEVVSLFVEMLDKTWSVMKKSIRGPTDASDEESVRPVLYELSEKYSSTEYVYLPVSDVLVEQLIDIHRARHLDIVQLLDEVENIFFYFVRFEDASGNRLTAIRRNIQFTGLVTKPILTVINDQLRLADKKVFKLDSDFDLMIDSENVHIWRPNSFRILGDLSIAIKQAAVEHINKIQDELPFIDLSTVAEYTSDRSRAAQYVAAINSRGRAKDIDRTALEELCQITDIQLDEGEDGRLSVSPSDIMGLLEVLDRRRYSISLVPDKLERYRAASRSQI